MVDKEDTIIDFDSLEIGADNIEENNKDDGDNQSNSEDEALRCYGDDDDDNIDDDGSLDPDPETTGIAREPRDKLANKLSFHKICSVLEYLSWKGQKKTKQEKLNLLLPAPLLDKFRQKSEKVPESIFPLFRLLMQEKDSSRTFSTKAKSLATAYAGALGFEKENNKSIMLHNWTDPVKLASIHTGKDKVAGDFSLVVEKVLEGRVSKTPSKATIGDINRLLDRFSHRMDKDRQKKSAHNWSSSSQSQSQSQYASNNSQRKQPKKKSGHRQIREEFVKALNEELHLSPMEHKWIVRIILGESMKIGIGFDPIMDWYSPYARDVYKAHNSLKSVCYKCCDPGYIRQLEIERKEDEERRKEQRFCQLHAYSANPDPIRLCNTISAMKSERTSFESFMTDISSVHLEILKKKLPKEDPVKDSLSLKFPAFISEVKLDGERFMIHVKRGQVTMHTRNGSWYSRCYSPVVGPALRRALANYDVDVILDAEVLAWDDGRKEPVPFGSNRTVAIARRKYMQAHGLADDIDRGLHKGENDAKIITPLDFKVFAKENVKETVDDSTECGAECWLQVVLFDCIYIDGPDAGKLLTETLSEEAFIPGPGSLTHLSLFERKRILYRLIETQKNEVEIVQSLVIRPNGECVKGEDYFSSIKPIMEFGLPLYLLDSVKWTLNVGHKSLKKFDETRRKGRSDMEISNRRTHFVNHFYHAIVHVQKLEGLVFKDLASPYILRSSKRLWLKIKPDFSNEGELADLDVVVIGSCWASGLRASGEISSFLCACVDSKEDSKFFTFCRINARSFDKDKLAEIMQHTQFKKATATEPVCFGKWFTEEEHGSSIPDFISSRSFQRGKEDDLGWKWSNISYPDLFIKPEDSVVITVKAGEIVPSDEYSAGLTLRFPRAEKLRLGADAKPANQVENEESLYRLLRDYEDKRSHFARSTSVSGEFDLSSPSKSQHAKGGTGVLARFRTVEQHRRSQKYRIRNRKAVGRIRTVQVDKKESNALTGLKFYVLEGAYSLDPNSADGEEAKREGWLDEAARMHQAIDVMFFIKKHNGTVLRSPGLDVRVIGGSSIDFKVINNIRGFDKLKEKYDKKRKKDPQLLASNVHVPGVLKWTYVLSVVFRWLREKEVQKQQLMQEGDYSSDDDDDDTDDVDECISLTIPHLLEPRFFDFLAQSEKYGDEPYEAIWRHGDLDEVDMKRATSSLPDSKTAQLSKRSRQSTVADEIVLPWQQAGLEKLSPNDRWVLSCQYEKLWPYNNTSAGDNGDDDGKEAGAEDLALWFIEDGDENNNKEAVVLYADLFDDDFGLEVKDNGFADDRRDERWKSLSADVEMGALASTLPLLRCMGCLVTCHLHNRVTHVLCDTADGKKESMLWKPGASFDGFLDKQHGRKLLQRLDDLFDRPVLLVTRSWVVSKWN